MQQFARTVYATLLSVAAVMSNPRLVAAQDAPSGSPAVTGIVFDSLARAPLANAVVQLVRGDDVSRSLIVRTDARGAFSFDSVAPGRYVTTFLHPRLDSLHLASAVQQVNVTPRGARVGLYVPSRRALTRALCGERAAKDSTGLFLGHIRPAGTNARAGKSRLFVQWMELVIDRGVRRDLPTLLVDTNDEGAFVVCGVPADARLLVQAWTDRDTSGVIEIYTPASGVLLRDLYVGHFDRVAAAKPASDDSATVIDSVFALRGTGRVRGVVRTPNGQGVAGARLRVRDGASEAVTDAGGAYLLQGVPTGTHLLEAVAIGYQPSRIAVDIADDSAVRGDVELLKASPTLDTMRVYAARDNRRWTQDFNNRKKLGMGRFIDEETLIKQDPVMVADALRMMPGIVLKPGGYAPTVLMRSYDADVPVCVPNIYVDGIYRSALGGPIDTFVSGREVLAIEIYRSPMLAPAQFMAVTKCGIIVLWTGFREPRVIPDRAKK